MTTRVISCYILSIYILYIYLFTYLGDRVGGGIELKPMNLENIWAFLSRQPDPRLDMIDISSPQRKKVVSDILAKIAFLH